MGLPTRVPLLAVLALATAVWLAPGAADAALVKAVTTGSQTLANSASATNIAMTGVDITKAFVVCSTRTSNTLPNTMLVTCALNNGGSGGAAQLTLTPAAAPGASALIVQYTVVEFTAGVSVQRGTTTFTGTTLTADSAPSITAVDCTKSFVLTTAIDTDNSNARDELWEVRAILGTGASPCTSGTTTSLELTRDLGRNGTTVTVAWQVVTLEGASVQRGTSCIGGSGANPACALGTGGTNGLTNRVVLGTAVDTTKSFILVTSKGGSSIAGVEGEYRVRGEFTATGASVTGVQFARSQTVTTNNHQVDIAYEVVSLSDGSTVQTSGASPTTVTATTATGTGSLTTVDTTRTAVFFSVSGGSSGTATVYDDTAFTAVLNGAAAGASSITFTRTDTTNVGTNSIAWFAVSFSRCTTPSGVAYDTLCTLGASTTGNAATVNWSSVNTALLLKSTSAIAAAPVNGTTYTTASTISGVPVVYSGATATDTSFADSGLTAGTTYHYKMWAKAGPTAACAASPCYMAGTEVTITPRVGNTTWSSIVSGGAALNPVVAGSTFTAPVSFGSNAGKVISLNSTTGAWASVPGNTVAATQGYASVFPLAGGSDAVVAADQSGWVYSFNPSTGAVNWLVKLNADAIQAAVSTYLRGFFSSQMTTTYPGTYDIVFVATMNNTGSGGFTNNKVYALRSDTGATLWTFSPATLSVSPCASGCPMDQITGQPWVDYTHDRLYITSRPGNLANQNSLWFLDLRTSGTLTTVFGGGYDFTTAPSQSFDNNTLYIGDQAGNLHIVNLTTLVRTINLAATGTSFKGFVWEDFGTTGRLYFVTTDGNVWCLVPPSTTPCWKTKPVSSGTVSQLVESDVRLWVGGSDGSLYQLDLTTGVAEKTFVVGAGSLGLGPVSTESGDELFVAATDGTLYKISLSSGSLP